MSAACNPAGLNSRGLWGLRRRIIQATSFSVCLGAAGNRREVEPRHGCPARLLQGQGPPTPMGPPRYQIVRLQRRGPYEGLHFGSGPCSKAGVPQLEKVKSVGDPLW